MYAKNTTPKDDRSRVCLSRLRVQLCIELYKSYCTVYTLTLFSFLDSPVGGWVELCPPTTTSLSGSCKVTNLARHPPCARSPRSGSLVYTSSHLPPLRRALPGCLARTASRGPRPRALCTPHISHVVLPAVLWRSFPLLSLLSRAQRISRRGAGPRWQLAPSVLLDDINFKKTKKNFKDALGQAAQNTQL